MKRDWLRFLRYLAVGGLNTVVGYASYAAFVLAGAPLWLAVSGSTLFGFFFNFASYGGLVFGDTSFRLLPRFLAFYAGLGGLNFLLLRGLTWSGLGPLWAQALLLPVLAGVGFSGMRRLVFRGRPPGVQSNHRSKMPEITLRDERGFNQIFAPVGSTPLRAGRRNDWFVAQARQLGARRILELGCGSGEAAAHVAEGTGAEVVAVDVSEKFLEMARSAHSLPNLRFEKLDLLTDDPGRFGRFDLVFGNGILHHLVLHLNDVLRALHSLSNPGGGLAFIEPNFLNPYCAFIFGTRAGRRFAKLEPDEMAFRPSELRRALPAAGWRDVTVTTRDFLLPGLPDLLARPILAIEPALEATAVTRWLAQSHFISARA